MVETLETLTSAKERNDRQVQHIIERVFAAARPNAVFGEPVTSGNYTVITASQISSGGGFGSGLGIGPATRPSQTVLGETPSEHPEVAGGGGMGGGGGAIARPIAVISIGPDGVTVKPILDATSVALAAIAVSLAMLRFFSRRRPK